MIQFLENGILKGDFREKLNSNFSELSSKYSQTQSFISSMSSIWETDSSADLEVRSLTANWQETFLTFHSISSTFLTTETDSQTLSWNENTQDLTISNGNTLSLSSLNFKGDLEVRALTGNWNDSYTLLQLQSATWTDTISSLGLIVSKKGFPGHFSSIQEAILVAESQGSGTRITVWPGTYVEDINITQSHIHVQSLTDAMTWSTQLQGTLNYLPNTSNQVCTWTGIDINAGASTALILGGNTRSIIRIEDANIYGGFNSTPTISSVNTHDLSDLILKGCTVRGLSANKGIESTCGRLKFLESEIIVMPGETAIHISNSVAGGFSTLKEFEILGSVLIEGSSPAHLTFGSINGGNSFPLIHNGTGNAQIADLVLYTSQVHVLTSTNTGLVIQGGTINWANPFQSLPSTVMRAPGTTTSFKHLPQSSTGLPPGSLWIDTSNGNALKVIL